MTPDVPVYMSFASAARYLGLNRNAIWQAYTRGRIDPSAYVDDRPVFGTETLHEYMRSRQAWIDKHPNAVWLKNMGSPTWGSHLWQCKKARA